MLTDRALVRVPFGTFRNQILGQLESRGLADEERRTWLLIIKDIAQDLHDQNKCLRAALRLVVDRRDQ